MTDVKQQAINSVVDQWFVQKSKRISIVNDKLKSKCWGMYQDYKINGKINTKYEDFKADFMLKVYEAMFSFEPEKNGSTWQDVLENADKPYKGTRSVISGLSAYTYAKVGFSIIDEYREPFVRVGHGSDYPETKVYMPTQSYNITTNSESNDEIMMMLSDDSDVFKGTKDTTHKNYISTWFDENKEKMLLKTQLKTIEQLETFDIFNPSNEDLPKHFGVSHQGNVKDKLDKIANRTLKKYNEEQVIPLTHTQVLAKSKLEMLKPIIDLMIDDSDLDNQNKEVSQVIYSVFPEIQMQLKLTLDEHQAANRHQLTSKQLYKVCQQLEMWFETLAKIAKADDVFTPIQEFYKKPTIRPKWLVVPPGAKKAYITSTIANPEAEYQEELKENKVKTYKY